MAHSTTAVVDEIELIESGGGGGDRGGQREDSPGGGDNRGGSGGGGEVPQRAYITGITVALAAILMFFMALISAYIVRKGFPNSGWRPLEMPRILWLNTLVLLVSSATIARARRLLRSGNTAGFRQWWWATTALGMAFLWGQVVAWRELAAQGVYLASNPSSSFFYLFTAAHGLHLAGGVIALVAVAVRQPHRLTRGTAVEVTSIYWHFMDGLWVFLFLILTLGR
jgi:cytochrome c oxidase subunit 3